MCRSASGLATAWLLFAIPAAIAQAANIELTASRDRIATVTVEGTLSGGDGDKFEERTSTLRDAMVVFRSDGGTVIEAIKIGETIHRKGFSSLVVTGCTSACALAWLGGTQRFMAVGAKIGFHAAFNAQTGQESGVGNALVGAYLSRIDLSYKAVAYTTSAPPNLMTWLTVPEAKQNGIDVTPLDVPDSFYVAQALARVGKLTDTETGPKRVQTVTIRSAQPGETGPKHVDQVAESFVVQVAVQRTEADAQASFRTLQSRYSMLNGQYALIRRMDQGMRGTFYAAQVGPFASRNDADQLCDSLRSAGGSCMVLKN